MKFPKINDVFKVADSYITKDQFVRKSIEENYMDIDQFTIAKYVSMTLSNNINCNLEMDEIYKEVGKMLPSIYFATAIEFQVSPSYVKRMDERSRSIRSRHMNS